MRWRCVQEEMDGPCAWNAKGQVVARPVERPVARMCCRLLTLISITGIWTGHIHAAQRLTFCEKFCCVSTGYSRAFHPLCRQRVWLMRFGRSCPNRYEPGGSEERCRRVTLTLCHLLEVGDALFALRGTARSVLGSLTNTQLCGICCTLLSDEIRKVRWTELVACMRTIWNEFVILAGKPEGKWPLKVLRLNSFLKRRRVTVCTWLNGHRIESRVGILWAFAMTFRVSAPDFWTPWLMTACT
jgi:hypothetical protein